LRWNGIEVDDTLEMAEVSAVFVRVSGPDTYFHDITSI